MRWHRIIDVIEPSRDSRRATDVAHCRVNLLTLGASAAEQFTALWQQAAGAAYHPWADVVTVIGFLDDLRGDWGSERLRVPGALAP